MRRRKNFLPTLILAILFWLSWLYIVFFVSPEETIEFSIFNFQFSPEIKLSLFSIFLFFLTLFLALTLILSLIFANTRRGFLVTLGIIGFLILRIFDLTHYLNLVLLAGILFSLEIYFSKK